MTPASHRTSFSRVGDCHAPATHRVEGYSPGDGNLYGSLDMTAYACDEHLKTARNEWLDGLTPWSAAYGSRTLGATCGRTVRFAEGAS